ncbi:hypothetical protein XELAEV_18007988mg [Xenopus laevis]|uniref:Uncharacterized protein n=1 Tax=Xenopus laevis TaxID=8355 RepID=A0A974I5W4_XENLA|nr:hypothetical protein XELAEV_18007988mg [Xenopus laevis]
MLHTDTRLKQISPELPLLSYRQPPNLRKMIVRSALPNTTKTGTFPCNRCETCKYILCKDQVALPNTQKVYTILDHYSCTSSNVEAYTLEKHDKNQPIVNHHRHKINTKSCDTPVGQHFCIPPNIFLQDMKVLILKGNFKTERERKIYEFKCMELFNTLKEKERLKRTFICILPDEGALVLRKLAMYFYC